MDADIDKVMSGLDRIIEAAPSYEKLFMRWQRQQWSTEDFDFTEDAKPVGRPGPVHRGGAQVPALRLLAVLPRRGAGHGRAAAVRDGRALARGAGVPDHADLRRGQAHGLLRPLLPRGARDEGRRHRRDARHPAHPRQQGLGDALRRDPPRLRRAPAQGPERLRGARPRDHRLHGRDRGDAGADRRPLHHPERSRSASGCPASPPASRRSTATSRATSASGSSSSPTRSRTTRRTRGSSRRR